MLQFYPELSEVELTDYKVRILSGQEAGTNSGVRVMVEMKRGRSASPPWGRARTSSGLLKALTDGYAYALLYPVATPRGA